MKHIFLQNKLWRDKMVDKAEAEGSVLQWRILSDAEYDKQLRIKLEEETQEVCKASTREELMAELADVLEVIESLCAAHLFSKEEIEAIRQKKKEARGGFEGRKYVETAAHPVGSYLEQYCVAEPEKYPYLGQPQQQNEGA